MRKVKSLSIIPVFNGTPQKDMYYHIVDDSKQMVVRMPDLNADWFIANQSTEFSLSIELEIIEDYKVDCHSKYPKFLYQDTDSIMVLKDVVIYSVKEPYGYETYLVTFNQVEALQLAITKACSVQEWLNGEMIKEWIHTP